MVNLFGKGPTRNAFSPPAPLAQRVNLPDPPLSSRVVIVLGGGGHTTEILHLVDGMSAACEYHYLLAAEDSHSESKIRRPGQVHKVPRPRYRPGKSIHFFLDPWLSFKCLLSSLSLLWHIQPVALLTSGPSIGFVTGLAARLIGARVIFVETGSRMTTLSGTGMVMRYLATDFFVQSQQLLDHAPKARYAGRLW